MPRSLARLAPLPFVAATACLVWPVYPWLGNSVEPRVFGLPWSLVYVLLVIAADTALLAALYLTRAVDAGDDEARGG